MGVNRSELHAVPSLALGTSEVTLLEMVSAYCTFTDDGRYREPIVVTRIEDRNGRILEEFVPATRQALSAKTARTVLDMMRSVVDRGTGSRIRSTFGISQDVAGKTGTTQGGADGWFILMHPELVAGSWVGFNDPRISFRTDYWGQGGNNALFIVGDYFRQALATGAITQGDATFPSPPEFAEEPSVLVRLGDWLEGVVVSVWESLFGPGRDDESPRQSDTYIADRTSGGIQIDLDEGSESIADSLTRIERGRNRLDSLLQLLPSRRSFTDTASGLIQDEEAPDGVALPDEQGQAGRN
jgi:penicillin-binding protein 1A